MPRACLVPAFRIYLFLKSALTPEKSLLAPC